MIASHSVSSTNKDKKFIINNKFADANTVEGAKFMLLYREFLSYQLSED